MRAPSASCWTSGPTPGGAQRSVSQRTLIRRAQHLAALDLGHDEWLDDETHWIWELAVELTAED